MHSGWSPAIATLFNMRDTSPDAEQVMLDAIRRTAPVERMRRAFALSESMRELALARLRSRHPERSDLELVELLLGESLIPENWHGPKT
jgi:hypothetical protein